MVKDAVPFEECKRALVIKLRHHGDVLLASPVMSCLKNRAPRMEVDALVYDDTAPMLEGHPALSKLVLVGRKWKETGVLKRAMVEKRLFENLRERRYDLVVHLSEQPRGAWLARALGARFSVAPAMRGRGRFWAKSFTHFYPIAARRHQVELNLDALRRIGLQPSIDDRKVLFVPGGEAEARVEKLIDGKPFIHVHPASRWRFKCWPAQKNAELIDRLAADGYRVVLTAAPDKDELALVDEILGKAGSKPLNLAGKLSIKELGALTARARCRRWSAPASRPRSSRATPPAGGRGACCASIRSTSATCGATGPSPARRAPPGGARRSTSCSPTSAFPAATSTAPATGCTGAGSSCAARPPGRSSAWASFSIPITGMSAAPRSACSSTLACAR